MIRRPPRSTLFPTRRSSDLGTAATSPAGAGAGGPRLRGVGTCTGSEDRKSTRLNSSHVSISYAVFCLKKKKKTQTANSNLNKQNAKTSATKSNDILHQYT